MINYIEKGVGLHNKIASLGYTLTQLDAIWVSSNDAEVQVIIDEYTLDEVREETLNEVRSYVSELIYSRLSLETQLNIASRSTVQSILGFFNLGDAAYDSQQLAWKELVLATYNTVKTNINNKTNIQDVLTYPWRAELDLVGVPG